MSRENAILSIATAVWLVVLAVTLPNIDRVGNSPTLLLGFIGVGVAVYFLWWCFIARSWVAKRSGRFVLLAKYAFLIALAIPPVLLLVFVSKFFLAAG
jgi:hypothetical protein